MTEKDKFYFEMMNAVELAHNCQLQKQRVDYLFEQKKVANFHAEFTKEKKLKTELRKAKVKLRDMRKILKDRQMRLL